MALTRIAWKALTGWKESSSSAVQHWEDDDDDDDDDDDVVVAVDDDLVWMKMTRMSLAGAAVGDRPEVYSCWSAVLRDDCC